jgi:hypothetical protein
MARRQAAYNKTQGHPYTTRKHAHSFPGRSSAEAWTQIQNRPVHTKRQGRMRDPTAAGASSGGRLGAANCGKEPRASTCCRG